MTSPTSYVWHPFTQHALSPDAPLVLRGEGAWLQTDQGKLLDAISSWWVITHGHRHPRIVEAIKQQIDRLDQVIFAGFTHQPAEDLAQGLIEIAPRGLAHVFYSDSGSTAVEVALKMALGFWKNQGRPRTRIIALEHAYHGDTVGTMSAGARGVFNATYAPLLFDVERLPFPTAGREQQTLDALERAAKDAAALIVEPLILGAGGMLVYSPDLLHAMAAICRRYGVLFIADEAMTGFGRTGSLFACDQADVTPDILCLAKGLSGGSLPLAATLCTPAIFDAHYSTDRSRTFFHSSSFTANPVACAAGCAESGNLEDGTGAGPRRGTWRAAGRKADAVEPRPALRECPPPGHDRRHGPESARRRLSGGNWPGTDGLFPCPWCPPQAPGQHDLCHAPILRHGGGTGSGL